MEAKKRPSVAGNPSIVRRRATISIRENNPKPEDVEAPRLVDEDPKMNCGSFDGGQIWIEF